MAAVGQLYAIVIAVLTPLAALVGIYRTRKLVYAALVAQVVAWVELGAIAYAIDPSPAPAWTVLVFAAVGFAAIDVVFIAWAIFQRRRLLRSPVSLQQLDRANDRVLVSRVLTIAVVVLLLLSVKPWIGIACLIFNVLWMCLWIPSRMRTYRMSVAADIAASPSAVFPYLVDPTKWNLYRVSRDGTVVSVRPPGVLARGSEIVTRMTVSPGKRVKPYVVETTSVVTAIEPDMSYSTVWRDRPSEHATTRVEPASSGTRLSFELEGVQPYRPASMGVMLDVGAMVGARRQEMAAAWARLKAFLEAAPTSQ